MITRQDIGELARFESSEGAAVSFYFQPSTPQDMSHRNETILIKDLVRDALRRAERAGLNGVAKADLERIQELAERLRGNNGRAKAVFACGKHDLWREYDLPARIPKTVLHMNNRFHLRPLTALADVLPKVGIVVLDRTKARLLEMWMGDIQEFDHIEWELPRRGKSDGALGFDAGHAERHVEHHAKRNFRELAERLQVLQDQRHWEKIVIGCRDETWPDVEPELHTYTRQKFIGRLAIEPYSANTGDILREAERLLVDHRRNRMETLVREVIGQAHRDSRGALGLKHVLGALERGEVQTLLIGREFASPVVQCRNCAHIDIRMVKNCAACGGETSHIDDVADLLLAGAVRGGVEIVHVPHDLDSDFEKVGVAALLRFRADQNTNEALAS